MPKKKSFVALALGFHSVANVINLFTVVSYDFFITSESICPWQAFAA
jgi:hypothetical protein